MKKLFRFSIAMVILMALSLIAFVGATPAKAGASVFTDNFSIPIDLFVYVPCAAGGAGELVLLQGPLHILFQTVVDSRGGIHATTHFQPQGISGTGFTTGDMYHATGATLDRFNGTVGTTYTYVNNFKIIGVGPGNNFLVHENIHFTFNANGQVTASVDNFSVECK